MKKTRHFFNLLEIALAIAVIAIGLSGVMSLYALGAKTHQTAMADNQVANIAEYFIAYIKAEIIKNNSYDASSDNFELPNSYIKKLGSKEIKTHITEINDIKKGNLSDITKWELTNSTNDENNYQIYKHKDYDGVFLYQQKTEDSVDFSALIFVYEDSIKKISFKRALKDNTNWQTFTNDTEFKKYAKSICIDICYPAELSWDSRKTITFRTEIFNEKFKLQ